MHLASATFFERSSHGPNSQATSGRFGDRGVRLGGFTGFLSRIERAATWESRRWILAPPEVLLRRVLSRIYLGANKEYVVAAKITLGCIHF